jgi:hypothetical protein
MALLKTRREEKKEVNHRRGVKVAHGLGVSA